MLLGWKWVWALVAVTNATVLLINIGMLWSTTAVIDVAQVQQETGYAYRSPVNDVDGLILEAQFGAWDRRTRQKVALLENGSEIGFHAASLRQIREVGQGASLQWGPTFFFSTPDNSDPRSNGRTYAIVFPLVVKQWIVGALGAMTLLLGGMWGWGLKSEERSRLWQSVIAAVRWMQTSPSASSLGNTITICGVAAAGFMVHRILIDATESLPTLSPDSFSYLGWFQTRTPGYPLFLQAIFTFTDDARWIVSVQLTVLLIASMVVGWAVGRLFQSRMTGVAVALSLFSATPILMMSWQVLTEILYAACMCVHVAAVATFLRTASRTAALLVGSTAGAVIAIRPSGYALVACFPILLLFKPRSWRSTLGFLTGGLVMMLALIVGAQYAKHGLLSTQSFGGFSLAGHVAPLITEDLMGPDREITVRVARRLAPFILDIPDPFTRPAEHTHAYLDYVNPMLYGNIMPELLAVMHERDPSLPGPVQWRRADAAAMSLALSAIISRPSWYVMHGLANYAGMWRQLETDIGRLESYLPEHRQRTETLIRSQPGGVRHFHTDWYASGISRDRYRPVDPSIHILDHIWAALPYWRPAVVRLIFLSSLLAMLGLCWGDGLAASSQCVIYTGLALQACIGFLGFVVPGTYRFVVPLLPLLIVFAVGGSVIVIRGCWKKSIELAGSSPRPSILPLLPGSSRK